MDEARVERRDASAPARFRRGQRRVGQRRISRAVFTAGALALLLGAISGGTEAQIPDRSFLAVDGDLTVHGGSIDFECGAGHEAMTCQVVQRYELEGGASGAQLHNPPPGRLRVELSVDGRPARGMVFIESGQRCQVEARVVISEGLRPFLYVAPPIDYRHLLLGEGRRHRESSTEIPFPTLRGPGVEVDGSIVVRGRATGLTVQVDGEEVDDWPRELDRIPRLLVSLEQAATLIANGGPAVTLGGALRSDRGGGGFRLGVGYELSLVEYLVLSVWFETDFDAIAEALVLEVASPGLFIVVPSLSAGVGVVATQLGARGTDAALRLRVGASFPVLGFVADFDYFPSGGTWSIGLSARAGL